MSGGFRDLLPHFLVLGESNPDTVETFRHSQTRGHLHKVSSDTLLFKWQGVTSSDPRLALTRPVIQIQLTLSGNPMGLGPMCEMKVKRGSLQATPMNVGHRGKRHQVFTGHYNVIRGNIYLTGVKRNTVEGFRSRLGNLACAPRKSLSTVPFCLSFFLSRFHNFSNKSLFFSIAKLHGSAKWRSSFMPWRWSMAAFRSCRLRWQWTCSTVHCCIFGSLEIQTNI